MYYIPYIIGLFETVAFLPRSEFDALQTRYLETHAEKENLELQYNLKAEFEDPPTRVRRIWVEGPLSPRLKSEVITILIHKPYPPNSATAFGP